ncbi:MAG: 2'-5' RNA ligase family protein [Pseudomonadota bacterium]
MIYALAYPRFDDEVTASIAEFRSRHEPDRANLVAPHVTLVFALKRECLEDFIRTCERVTSCTDEFEATFVGSEIVHDPFENAYKMFLCLSNGQSQLISLHEKLYDGPQRSELPPDVPYRPHMTVATNKERSELEKLDSTSIARFPISARISTVEIAELAKSNIQSLKTLRLRA